MMDDVAIGWFQEKLKVDKFSLDDALVEQPELYQQVGEQTALASSRLEEAKAALRETDATLYAEWSETLKEEGGRVTESAIQNAITTDDRHISATGSVRQAKLVYDQWLSLKESYQQRSYMLKDLAGLWVSNYYTQDAVRGGDAGAVRQASREEKRREISKRRAEKKTSDKVKKRKRVKVHD